MNNTIPHLEWRYAVKKFDSKGMLSNDKIAILKTAFNLTATSYGLQPVKMLVIQNKELQEALVPHSFNQAQVAQASHVCVLCIEKEITAEYIASYFKRVQELRGTSVEILNPFKAALTNNFSNKEQAEIASWAMNQAYLVMGNLLTICAIEKIDACPMEGFDPAGYDKLLQLSEKGLSAALVLPVGYRAADDRFANFKKVRKELSEIIIEIN